MKDKILVAYFSCTGTTARVARELAAKLGADLFAIEPLVAYSEADLNWRDKNSRSSKEMNHPEREVPLAVKDLDLTAYATVLIGFPIWWYVPPGVITTFMTSQDFNGKTVAPFATSGSSPLGKTEVYLHELSPEVATWLPGQIFKGGRTGAVLENWLKEIGLL